MESSLVTCNAHIYTVNPAFVLSFGVIAAFLRIMRATVLIL